MTEGGACRDVERDPANLISVIVCTYNRAEKLKQCLYHLLAMRIPDGVRCELICVDNNSTDSTKTVIEGVARASAIPVRYVFEAAQGSSNARNAGFRNAGGAIIAVADDDCMVDPSWLSAIWSEFRGSPQLGLVGGRVELADPADLPVTVRTSRERTPFTEESLFSLIPGCNFAFRRTVIDAIGFLDPHLGPGTALMSAEDVDFIYRAAKAGFEIVYSPEILLFHAHGRRSAQDLARLSRGYVIGRGAFYAKHVIGGDRHALRLAYWELMGLVKGVARALGRGGAASDAKLVGYLLLGAWRYVTR